ncbi:hypothetical protein [Chlorogloea sp. CCALA 695]|uniref:hypothetical protein n=1 Tax=Chlorogloea sp. CCALA 695 TaxID=2107693 RepID=UPI001E45A1AD|nr:hypothetical protein [Chlorogloea sp. CCALA 695]
MMMTMELNHYPGAIAQAAQRVNELDSEIMAVQQLLDRVEGNADSRSAFDIDLKNDLQRKARRFEVLLTDREYQTATNTLMRLTAEKANALAHLEYLRNQFSVAKLETRRAIAQQLTDFESRELVGL